MSDFLPIPMSEEQYTEVDAILQRVGQELVRKFGKSLGVGVDPSDVASEAWLYLHEHKAILISAFKLEKQRDRDAMIYRAVIRGMTRWARKVNAEDNGYEAADQFYYAPDLIRLALPSALDPDVTTREHSQQAEGEESRSGDPAHGRSFHVMLIDIEQAYAELSPAKRHLLYEFLVEDLSRHDLAMRHGVTIEVVELRVEAAMEEMCVTLNGLPSTELPEDFYSDLPVTERHVTTNAQARSNLAHQNGDDE